MRNAQGNDLRRRRWLRHAVVLLAFGAFAAPAIGAAPAETTGREAAQLTTAPAAAVGKKATPKRSSGRRARTCTRVLVLRRGSVGRLLRAGYRRTPDGRFVRRVGKRTITVCPRRAGTPRWVSRPLGGKLRVPARQLRSAHSVSKLEFPATLRGRFRIDLPTGLGESGWQMLDVPAAKVIRHRDGARYETSGYDVVYEAGYGRVKESIVVHQRQGLRTWRWKLHYTKGTRPTVDGEGRVVYGGKVMLDRPVIFNARGRKVMSPRWKISRNVVSVTVNDRRLGLPYVVDPTADFPQRINPDSVTGTRITGAENVRDPAPSLGPASSCTRLPIDAAGEALFGSMIARRSSGGAPIATTTPSGGANGWALQDGSTFTAGKKAYAMDAPDDRTVYVAGEDGRAMKSTDGGCTWTRLNTGTTVHLRGIATPNQNVVWVAGDAGTVRRSTDGGLTFTNANTTGNATDLADIDAVDANIATVVGKAKLVMRTANGGASWSSVGVSNMGDNTGVDMVDANTIWVVGTPGKVFKTTNAGGSWAYQLNSSAPYFTIAAANTNTAWLAGDLGAIAKTSDGGSTWLTQPSGVAEKLDWLSVVDTNTVWTGGVGGRILRTLDGGASWVSHANASLGSEVFSGAARSADLAWVGDDKGRVQRFYPNGVAGSWGWVSQAPGGATLSAGPWTIGARICREPYSSGTVDVGFRARVWKVRVSGTGTISASTPMTAWTTASPSSALVAGACASPTVSATPTVLSMLPTEHFYIEYALKVYGNARADETMSLSVADPDTYIDFSAAAADSTPMPTNLRTSTFMGPNGWTYVNTPTWRANLNDPDWWHHNRYQICADPACATVVAEGTSAAGQLFGSTNDSWTAPALADGFYYVRVRTEEDGGETDMSDWTPIDPDLSVNRCTAAEVGPCDKFGIDTSVPTAPTPVNDGTGADIAWTASSSMLSANWGASTDAGGILRYEYCMSTSTTAASCSGTVVQAWTSAGAALGVTQTGLALANGQIYFTCVRAVDNAGNVGTSACSDGQTVDTAAPPATAAVRDGVAADLGYTASTTQLDANWDAVADIAPGSGLGRYDLCFSTSSTGADCAGTATSPWSSAGTSTSASRTGLTLANGTTYYACVRAVDNVENIGAVRCSDGIVVDTTVPTVAWSSWTENSDWLYAPGGASPDLLWYNPSAPLEAGIYARGTVTAADAASGMNRVEFPSLAAGAAWGPGGTDTTAGVGDTWTHDYSFTGGGAIGDPALNNATAYDNVGNATGAPALDFRIEPDGAGTENATITPLSGLQSTNTTLETFNVGTDAKSGVARWVYDYEFTPLRNGVCEPFTDSWVLGDGSPTRSGAATNGQVFTMSTTFNDLDGDGVEDLRDSFCYRSRVRVYDNVQNLTTIGPNGVVQIDLGDPEASIAGPADGSSQAGTFDITGNANDMWTAVHPWEYPDTGSGLDRVTVAYELPDGPDADTLPDASGAACAPITTFTGTWDNHGWTCSWNTSTLPDGLYTVSVQARDRAGRLSTVQTRTFLIDNRPPVIDWHSWNEYGSAWMHALGNVAWVNPTAPAGSYQLDARVTAYDLGSGVNRVEFPAMGAGWTPSATSNGTFTDPVPAANAYTQAFTFTNPAAIVEPGTKLARAVDGAGNPSTTGYEVRFDGTAPTGMDATVVDGRQSAASVDVTLAAGSEGALESGLASWSLQYETAPLANDTCGTWSGTWTTITGAVGIAPASYAHDVTALGSQCYRYRLQVTDNVGNVGTSATPISARRVDLNAPTVDITSPLDASSQSATFTISGTAGDAHTGIDRVRLDWSGPEAPGSGIICDPATLGGSSPSWTFSCAWNTTTFDDGWYTITATSWDRAGNASATDTITVLLDNQAPVVAWHSWNDYANEFIHAVGNVAWINPTALPGTRSLDARVTATDAGSGVNRLEFPALGTGWTPTSTTSATYTSPTPTADAYTMAYAYTIPGIISQPGLQEARAYDGAGNWAPIPFEVRHDALGPTGGSMSYPNGYVPSTNVTVTFDTGSDAIEASGFREWQLQRADGILSSGSCSTWGAYTTVATGTTPTATGSVTDVVTDPGCFRYQLLAIDNVGNVTTITSTNEVKVDLTPPTGSLTIAEGTNPQWQFLASPSRIYVNTGAGTSGDFVVEVAASAASGILDVAFPFLASGFSGDGAMPGPGSTFPNTYSWTGVAGSPPSGLEAVVRSNSLGQLELPFDVVADPNPPTGATVTHPSGYSTSTSVTVDFTIGSDAGAGIQDHQLEREQGSLAGGTCTWSGTWTTIGPLDGPLSQTDSTLVHGSCYRYRVRVTDKVLNIGYSPTSTPVMIDQTAPTATLEFIESASGIGTALGGSPDTIWYQPTLGTSVVREHFSMRVRIVDAESGPGTVAFPAFAGNWALGAVTANADGSTQGYERWNYAAEPGAVTAVASNGAGLTATVTGNVLIDDGVSSAPTWSIDYVHGYDIDQSMTVTWVANQTDDRSGFASYELMRRSWPFSGVLGRCDESATPTDVSLGVGAAQPYDDLTLVQPTCYRYWLRLTDRAENVAQVWATTGGTSPALFDTAWPTWDWKTVAEVDDIFPPAPFSLSLPTNPALPAITTGQPAPSCATVPTYAGSTPSFAWTASSDAESGLKEYHVFVGDTSAIDGIVAAPGTSWTTPALADGAHTLGVRAVDNQNNFRNADPAFPTDVRVDSAPPSAALVSPAAGSWTSDTTPLLDWTAADANCVARVEVYLDDMTTPIAVASGSEGSWTPTTPLAHGSHQWKVVAIDTLGNATTAGPVTFGVDVVDPTTFSLTAPTAGQTVRGFVDVAWTASSDADSGLAPLTAYEVWVDGVLKTTVGAGFSTATVTGITKGTHTVFVRAYDSVGNSTDTTTVTFEGYDAIPAPVLVSPSDGAHTNTVPVLDWMWPSDGGPTPTSYEVYLDGALVGTETHPTTAHSIADPGNGVHSWKVVQLDPYTGTVSSTTWTFNLDRTAPANPGPLTRSTTTVSWPAPSDPASPTASGIWKQEFWVDDGVNPPTFTTLGAGATSRDYGTLPDGIYTMWVRAYDRAGNFTDSPSLVVTNDSVPPATFNLDPPAPLPPLPAITNGTTAPTCETAPTYTSAMPTLSWQPSSDSTSGLAGYDVYIDSKLVATLGPTTTSYTVASPLTGGAHAWQVVARDNFGLSRSSTPSPMNVRVDGASPAITYSSPADGGYTADTTPTLSWGLTDDNCAARVEVTVDGVVVAVTSGTATSWTPGTALAEGAHTWSLRAFDSAGNVTSAGPARTFHVDTTGPTGVTAIFPTNGGSVPEDMMTFEWSAGTDAGAGVARYDLTVDGVVVATGITGTTKGTYAIYAGSHTWAIRAYDAVGNSTLFSFTFTATLVTDITPPSAFNLLSPADGAAFTAGDSLAWEPAWDFKGVTQYRVYMDGLLIGTTAGNVTSFTPSVGTGSALCTVMYDPGLDAACLTGPTYTNGEVANADSTPASPASSDWNTASWAGWSASGAAHGFGDPTVAPSTAAGTGFDGDRMWSALEYSASIPAAGADLRFEHRYLSHMVGSNAYDGMTVELLVDDEADGFGNDVWEPTCTYGARAVYGTTLNCVHEVAEVDGGYNVAFGGPSGNHPLAYQNGFSGDSGGMVQTKLRLSNFAGMNLRIRFRVGTDGCYSGMPAAKADYCTKQGAGGWHRAVWRIDDVTLAEAGMAPGPHTWYVQARDAAGNSRNSTQTWTINVS